MADIIEMFNPDGDLEKPVWFYSHVEKLAEDGWDGFGQALEQCPLGAITFDCLYNELANAPVRLIAFAQGDDEIGEFLILAAVATVMWKGLAK